MGFYGLYLMGQREWGFDLQQRAARNRTWAAAEV